MSKLHANVNKNIEINQHIRNRVRNMANYILDNKTTTRVAAKQFGVSKATAHTDVAKRLQFIDSELYKRIQDHMEYNLKQRSFRGGASTRNKKLYKVN